MNKSKISAQEISKNLSGNLKIENSSCEQMLSHSIDIPCRNILTTGGQCSGALPDGQLTASFLPRSSCFFFALPVYSPHKFFENTQKGASTHPVPPPGGVAGGTSGGVGGIASAARAVPSEVT